MELMAMYGDSSGTSGVEAKTDHTKVSSKKCIGKKTNFPAAFVSVNF